ncbi:mitochondrial folate carrier protein Flx1, partial [Microthyrium microscopicum]
ETAAGFTAGVAATLVVHPLDVLKTRIQLETRQTGLGQSLRILRDIVKHEGSYLALYRGLTPNLVGNSVSWALYFMWYGSIKTWLQTAQGQGKSLTSLDYFAASGTSGILTALLTNPIWVIKTRMLSSGRNSPGAYSSMLHGVRHILKNEGLSGFWRGLVPSLFGISHGAVQFAAYEQLKNYRGRQFGGDQQRLSNWDYLTLSGLSKCFAGSVTYPFQVVRVRLQIYDADSAYRGTRDAVWQIWRNEGVRGFYKGLGPSLVRVLPSTCVTFLVYENTKFYLPRLY